MIGLTLKHFRYFDALAQHRHFGRAASACAISQPALSQQIKELEGLLGAPLVERGPREIRLTTLGESFAERAQAILRAVDDIGALAKLNAGPFNGPFRLGVIPTIAPYLLPRVIAELGQSFPELQVLPREAVTESLIEKLQKAELDAALVALPISEPNLSEMALFDEDFVLVRHVSDAKASVPSPEQLQKMKLLLLEEGHCFRDQALSFCQIETENPTNLMEGSSLATLVQMVGAGIGVTLIPEMSLDLETRNTPVSIAHFPKPAPSRTIGLVWRKSSPLRDQFESIGHVIQRFGLKNQG